MSVTFGERLKAARIMAGLSMDALVLKLEKRLSKSALSKYENGLMMPDSENLILLAKTLNVSPDFFFPKKTVELSCVNFRKKSSLGKKEVESLLERVKYAIERYIELETLLGLESPFINPLEGIVISKPADIEAAALKLREAWGVGKDIAIPQVLDVLEEHSIRIIEIDECDEFDGLSAKVNCNPFIVLNKNRPGDRKRLTALHELAHQILVFNAGLSKIYIEKLCHTFGGAFLMPVDILLRELGEKRNKISLPELQVLKEQFGISIQAIMFRAREHEIISAYEYERFSRFVSAKGWRKAEPVQYLIPDVSHRFKQLLHRALAEEIITISKAAYLSNKSIQEIEKELSLNDADSYS